MPYVENDLGVGRIDRVKDEIWVPNGWEHADAGLVGQMTSVRKFLQQASNRLDALDHGGRSCAITFVNVRKYVSMSESELSDQRTLMRCSD